AQDTIKTLQNNGVVLTSVTPIPLDYTIRDLDYAYGTLAASDSRSMLVFGPNFENQFDGMITMVPFTWTYYDRTFQFTERWRNLSIERPDLYPWDGGFDSVPYYATSAYDCVQVLARGYDQFLKKNPQYPLEALTNGSLRSQMDHRAFAKTGYEGYGVDVANLNEFGELQMPFLWYNLNKTMYWSWWVFPNDGFLFTEFDSFRTLDLAPYFPGNSSVAPSDGSRNSSYSYQDIELSSSEGKILVVFEVVGLLLALLSIIITVAYRQEKIIRSAAPPFLLLLIIGSMLSFISNSLYIGSLTTAKCQAEMFLKLTAFAMIFGALIVKNYRIHLLFSRRKLSTSKMAKLEYMMAAYAVIIIIEEILLILWATLLKPSAVTFESAKTLSYGSMCQIQSATSTRANIIVGFLYGYNILLLVLTLYVSYLVRRVSESYRESILLLILVMSISIVFGTVQSSSSTALNQVRSVRFSQAAAVWGVTTFALILIFGAKAIGLWMERFSLSRTSRRDWRKIFKTTPSKMGASTMLRGSQMSVAEITENVKVEYQFNELGKACVSIQKGLAWSTWKEALVVLEARDTTRWLTVYETDDSNTILKVSEGLQMTTSDTIITVSEPNEKWKMRLQLETVEKAHEFFTGFKHSFDHSASSPA
ncbi:hypothetical protein HDV05_004446, partial [Chytridiales sp. JEL 0842]